MTSNRKMSHNFIMSHDLWPPIPRIVPAVPTVCVSASGGGGGSGGAEEELGVAVGGVAAPSRERGRSPRALEPVGPECCQGEQQTWGDL